MAAIEGQLAELRAGADAVTLVGGEPSLHPGLAAIVGRARALGFAAVGLQSHGRHLDAAMLDALAGAGLTDLHLSIHGEAAPVHDFHTKVAGSFVAAFAALERARRRGIVTAVTTVLTRSNARSLAGLPGRLAAGGVAAWSVAVPAIAGRAMIAFESVAPRLGLALPHALHAVAAARGRGLAAFVAGAPLCALGPHRGWALGDGAGWDPPRAFAPACAGCPARAECGGLDPLYLARFGGDEVDPGRLRAAGAIDPPAVQALRGLFVGAGALVTSGLREAAGLVDPPRSRAARLARSAEEAAR